MIRPVCLLGYALPRRMPVVPCTTVLPGLRARLTAAGPATGYALMLRAAFRSRSHSKPQRSQRQVRSDSDSAALTAPHAQQVLAGPAAGKPRIHLHKLRAMPRALVPGIRTNSAMPASEMDRASRLFFAMPPTFSVSTFTTAPVLAIAQVALW